jgi:hypothetical protein
MEVDNILNHIDIDMYIDACETGYPPDEEESVYRESSIVYCLEQEFLFHNISIFHVICNHMFCHKYWLSVCQKLWDQFSVHVTVLHHNKFLCNKTKQMHLFHKFILSWNSACFRQFVCPSSGVYSPGWSCPKAVYKPIWHIPLLNVQWINSWWWTDDLSETCSVSWQNKFVKLVQLVGFITKKYGTNMKETICVLLQTWQIMHRDMKFAVCFYQCVRQPQLLNYCGSVALQCVCMWFQSLFIITWVYFASYLKYYSFLKVLSTMYFDTDQEINLILCNEWILWQVSTWNQNPFLSLSRP